MFLFCGKARRREFVSASLVRAGAGSLKQTLAVQPRPGKLATRRPPVHHCRMHRAPFLKLFVSATALLLAACATAPEPVAPTPAKPVPQVVERGDLIGLTADELGLRFGQPGFQVREGAGVKLQFSGGGCVLDAYLYPPESGAGVERVAHIDTRRPSGDNIDQFACFAMLATP